MAGQNHNEESQNEITNNGIEPVSQNEDEINSEGRHRWSLSVLIHHLLTLGKSYFEVGTKFIYIFQRMTC